MTKQTEVVVQVVNEEGSRPDDTLINGKESLNCECIFTMFIEIVRINTFS